MVIQRTILGWKFGNLKFGTDSLLKSRPNILFSSNTQFVLQEKRLKEGEMLTDLFYLANTEANFKLTAFLEDKQNNFTSYLNNFTHKLI